MTGLALLAALVAPQPPSQPYEDEGTRLMVERAQAVRDRELDGIESYEGLLREHVYVGLTVRRFGRERALYDAERVARVRWDRTDGRTVQWLGAREDAPILGGRGRVAWSRDDGDEEGGSIGIGLASGDSPPDSMGTPEEILRQLNPLVFDHRPGDDRLVFGNRFALHPLADTAGRSYRYRSGDTLTVALPGESRDLTLVEIVVEPLRRDFELIAGSLWFDVESAALVRAHYRPSRPFDLELDEGEDVPGVLDPFRVAVDYLTIEYSLHDGEWWMPRRFGLAGQVRAGGMLTMPVAVEWLVNGYTLNSSESEIPAEDSLPPGWVSGLDSARISGGGFEQVRILAPSIDSLRRSSLLSGESIGGGTTGFSEAELADIRAELDALVPARLGGASGLSYGWADGNLRYNRVEGLGVGLSRRVDLNGGLALEPRLMLGVADGQLRGSLALSRHASARSRQTLQVYRRLAHTDDFGDPHALGASLSNFLFRNGHTHFHDAVGVSLAIEGEGRRSTFSIRGFWEDHDPVDRETDVDFLSLFNSDTLPRVLAAAPGRFVGVSGEFGRQLGHDPESWLATGRLSVELTGGDSSYQRLLGTVSVRRPLNRALAVAVEGGVGRAWGAPPPQSQFFLGGARTLRGYPESAISGDAFWMARAEVGTRSPVVRLSLFTDLGWAGSARDLSRSRAFWASGAGLSLLDGLVRIDAAWPLRAGRGGRFYIYLDGLF